MSAHFKSNILTLNTKVMLTPA